MNKFDCFCLILVLVFKIKIVKDDYKKRIFFFLEILDIFLGKFYDDLFIYIFLFCFWECKKYKVLFYNL